MGNELKMSQQQAIQTLIRLGWSNRAIHRETGFHRDTISSYRKKFESGPKVPPDSKTENRPIVPPDPSHLPTTKSVQVFSFLEVIRKKFLEGLTGQRIYQDLVEEHDYQGSYYSIKRYLRKLRKSTPDHRDHLRTPPGKEAQVDFGKACPVFKNGKYRKCWLFKMTLTSSGHSYEELVWKQDVETFIRCHENAFRSFGGVTETIKLDNLKSGVLKAHLFEPELNEVYLHFSQHWGFAPNPCIAYAPEHKGTVEKDVGYTKSNALKGRRFDSLEEGNSFLRHWNKRWARTRIHGTTRKQVWKLFVDTEQLVLKPLADKPFPFFKIAQRKVSVYGHIEVATNFYSVPHQFIGQRLKVHYNNSFVKIYDSRYTLVANHRSMAGNGKCFTQAGHKPSYKPENLEMAEAWLCRDARNIGHDCHALIYKMLSGYDPLSIRRCRGIIALKKKYDLEIVNSACRQALYEHRYTYNQVKSFCEHLSSGIIAKSQKLTQTHDLIRDVTEYQTILFERSF